MQHKITPTAYFFTSIKFVFLHTRHVLMLCIIPVVLHFLIILMEYFIFGTTIFNVETYNIMGYIMYIIAGIIIAAIFTGVYLLYAVQSMHTDKTFNFGDIKIP